MVAATILVACSAPTGDGVEGHEYLSTSVRQAGADRPLVVGTRIRLSFRDGDMGASVGCNSMGGAYRIEDGRLVFSGGSMTEMGCDPDRHAQDDWLIGLLGSRPSIAQDGSELTLTAGETVIVLQDREVADPDRPLVGTTWTVDTLISGDAASSIPDGVTATLVFAGDGTVAVQPGCNSAGGRYEVGDGTMRITGLVTTDMACDGPAAMLESTVLGVLGADSLTYDIDAGSLTIMADDVGLVLHGDGA